jgi:hypothetical protein
VWLCAGFAADVLPLLAAGLLPGAADGHRVGRGVQGRAARAALPRALHAAAAAHHGLRQGTPLGPLPFNTLIFNFISLIVSPVAQAVIIHYTLPISNKYGSLTRNGFLMKSVTTFEIT